MLLYKIVKIHGWHQLPIKNKELIMKQAEKLENRLGGKKGIIEARERFIAAIEKRISTHLINNPTWLTRQKRFEQWKNAQAVKLAKRAGLYYRQFRGYLERGDFYCTDVVEYISTQEPTPLAVYNGKELLLLSMTRTRGYAKSSNWRPSEKTTFHLVIGDSDSYVVHAVPKLETVLSAIEWIWQDKATDIVSVIGNVALIHGKGVKMPTKLPKKYEIVGEDIKHEEYGSIPLPKVGQRIVIARASIK